MMKYFLNFQKTKQFCADEAVLVPIEEIDPNKCINFNKMLLDRIEENERDEQKEGETEKQSGKSSETNRGKDKFRTIFF